MHSRPLIAALALFALALLAPAGALADPVTATPTASAPFIGHAATPRPVTSLAVPQHPFMAPNERSNLHDDAYQTDSYLRSGPLGRSTSTRSASYMGVCGSVTFDARGRIVTVCVGVSAVTLRLLDPVTLDTLASYELPPRPMSSGNMFQNFTGGGYFYLDERDRVVVGTAARHMVILSETAAPGFKVDRDVDLTGSIPEGDAIISILPDWDGRYWFTTRKGVVGTVDRASGQIRAIDTKEADGNSFAVGEDGIYVVTDAAMYRFEAAADGTPKTVWREVYSNDHTRKLGQSEFGSGTTPTLMGPDLVAITDNADPIDVVVYRRARKVSGSRELCRAPVFARGASSSDQSLLSDGSNLVVENNYGYEGPQSVLAGLTTSPGLARVDVDRAAGRCTLRWTANQVVAPSVVPKLALGSGLVYTYTKPAGDLTDPWYLTALDYRTGETVYQSRVGTGPLFNNNYAPVTIGPDGTSYVGVLGGLAATRDAQPPNVPAANVIAPETHKPAVAKGKVRVRPRCVRGRLEVSVSDSRVRSLVVTAPHLRRTDTHPPLRLRFGPALRGRVVAIVSLRDGQRRSVVVRTRCHH